MELETMGRREREVYLEAIQNSTEDALRRRARRKREEYYRSLRVEQTTRRHVAWVALNARLHWELKHAGNLIRIMGG